MPIYDVQFLFDVCDACDVSVLANGIRLGVVVREFLQNENPYLSSLNIQIAIRLHDSLDSLCWDSKHPTFMRKFIDCLNGPFYKVYKTLPW